MNKTRFAMGDRRWEPYHGEVERVLAVIKARDDLAQLQRLERDVIVASRATCEGLIHADTLLPELSTALCALDQHMNDMKVVDANAVLERFETLTNDIKPVIL